MTIVIPTSPSGVVPAPTVEFTTTALSTFDSIGTYSVTLEFGSSTTNSKLVRIQVDEGTAVYYDGSTSKAADWVIDGSITETAGSIVQVFVPGGQTLWTINIRVNENMHSSETQIMTLLPGSGYRLSGSNRTHTATVAMGAIKPTAANTGHGGLANQLYTGSEKLQSASYSNLIFTSSSYKLMHYDIEFHNCWFKPTNTDGDYLVWMKAPYTGAKFYNCEFGNTGLELGTSYSSHFFTRHEQTNFNVTIDNCYFHHAGWDHLKLRGSGYTIHQSYFDTCGTGAVWYTGDSPHGDAIQMQAEWQLSDVDIYRCNFNLPVATGDASGYGYNSIFQMDHDNLGEMVTNLRIRSSWLIGCNATISAGEMIPGSVINSSIRNCRVGTRKDTDYRFDIIRDGSSQLERSGCISDHDGNMTPVDHNNAYVNTHGAF